MGDCLKSMFYLGGFLSFVAYFYELLQFLAVYLHIGQLSMI